MASDPRMKQPGPDHPITITHAGSHVVVRKGDAVIARTDQALALAEASYPLVYYIPRADVDMERLEASDRTSFCPFKGDATYFSIKTREGVVDDAVWTYEDPFPACAEIAGHLAFYADKVSIEAIEAP